MMGSVWGSKRGKGRLTVIGHQSAFICERNIESCKLSFSTNKRLKIKVVFMGNTEGYLKDKKYKPGLVKRFSILRARMQW
jgi:hypothetical protein